MKEHETTTRRRDEQLGAWLRELDVPEHRPAYHPELRRRLLEERNTARRRTRLRVGRRLAAAAAVAAAAVVVIALGIPRTSRTPSVAGPRLARAALVKAHVRTALGAMLNLSGVLVSDGPGGHEEQRWRFTIDAAGDVRLEGPGQGEAITYDARAGVARSAQRSASTGGATLFDAERFGVAPGPPDQGPPDWILPDEFAAFVRAALATGDPTVHEIAYEGRPAWRLDVDTVPNALAPELSGDRFEITIDRRTAMPVRVVETKHGAFLRELRIENLAVNRKLPPDTFRLAFPAGAEVLRSDDGFRRVGLDDVSRIVGYRPLVPSWVPTGYRLAEVAVARESAPTGTTGGNPPSQMVVSLSYRRGLDQLLVTTRLRGSAGWSDPLASAPGFDDRSEAVSVAAGSLAGAAAQLVVDPRTVPHLWAVADGLVVTVGGDLSRGELARVAGSLRSR